MTAGPGGVVCMAFAKGRMEKFTSFGRLITRKVRRERPCHVPLPSAVPQAEKRVPSAA